MASVGWFVGGVVVALIGGYAFLVYSFRNVMR